MAPSYFSTMPIVPGPATVIRFTTWLTMHFVPHARCVRLPPESFAIHVGRYFRPISFLRRALANFSIHHDGFSAYAARIAGDVGRLGWWIARRHDRAALKRNPQRMDIFRLESRNDPHSRHRFNAKLPGVACCDNKLGLQQRAARS